MSIVITQTCDVCGRQRILRSKNESENGGWRELNGKWLCPETINVLLKPVEVPHD